MFSLLQFVSPLYSPKLESSTPNDTHNNFKGIYYAQVTITSTLLHGKSTGMFCGPLGELIALLALHTGYLRHMLKSLDLGFHSLYHITPR